MARPIRLLGFALAGALLLASPALSAPADWGRLLTPVGGGVVAGGVTEVRWTALPAGIDEFELLLSIDDGRSYGIRLTPQLDPRIGLYSWRVPNLSAARARLRLRVGLDGDEVEGPPGPVFTIVADRSSPLAALAYRGGEWWPVAGSPPVASWLPETPGRVARETVARSAPEESAIAPRPEDPAPAAAGWHSATPTRPGSEAHPARSGPGRPVPVPPLRP